MCPEYSGPRGSKAGEGHVEDFGFYSEQDGKSMDGFKQQRDTF